MVTITNVRKNVILVVNNYEIIILAVKKSVDVSNLDTRSGIMRKFCIVNES